MIPFYMTMVLRQLLINHTWDYLKVCCDKGIVFNKNKFQFCEDSVEFVGLKITSSGILPSDHILIDIQDFPTLKTLTDARSWFDLVSRVAWACCFTCNATILRSCQKSLIILLGYKLGQNFRKFKIYFNQSSYWRNTNIWCQQANLHPNRLEQRWLRLPPVAKILPVSHGQSPNLLSKWLETSFCWISFHPRCRSKLFTDRRRKPSSCIES